MRMKVPQAAFNLSRSPSFSQFLYIPLAIYPYLDPDASQWVICHCLSLQLWTQLSQADGPRLPLTVPGQWTQEEAPNVEPWATGPWSSIYHWPRTRRWLPWTNLAPVENIQVKTLSQITKKLPALLLTSVARPIVAKCYGILEGCCLNRGHLQPRI